MPFSHRAKLVSTEKHEKRETKQLLPDEESCLGFGEEGGIPMGDLSDSDRSSEEGSPRLPYHKRATRAIRNQFSSRLWSMPYQPIPPATF